MIADKDLLSIQQARILAENALEAQKRLAGFAQSALDDIVEGVAAAVLPWVRDLAVMSQEETDYGRWQDKELKNRFACERVGAALRGMRCVGELGGGGAGGVTEIGVPRGVIAALCPVTGPVSTTIYKTLLAIKSANAVVFAPHPRALKSMRAVLDIMVEAGRAGGLPEGSLSCLATASKSGARELMRHPAVSLLLLTGVPGMYSVAARSGKPLIYGGAGGGPAFIERSADISRAVSDIIRSKSFDNGIAPAAELALVVDAAVAGEVRAALAAQGGYFMREEEASRLVDLFFHADGRCKKGSAGLTAVALARRGGFAAPEGTALLIADRRYVSANDPYAKGFPAPVLACYVEDDWGQACEKCIELLLSERSAHTLSIHSRDPEIIRQFALKKPVARLLVNTPAVFGGIGASSGLFPALTLGSGCAGYGITSDNLSPSHLTYIRQIGHGLEEPRPFYDAGARQGVSADWSDSEGMRALRKVLNEFFSKP